MKKDLGVSMNWGSRIKDTLPVRHVLNMLIRHRTVTGVQREETTQRIVYIVLQLEQDSSK